MTFSPLFEHALAFTTSPAIEGGDSNDPVDAGGPTSRGITQAVYDSYRDRHSLPRQQVELMLDQEERAIYSEEYWTPCHCESMPAGLGAAVFDMAVNAGIVNATVALQEALGVARDGSIGEKTLAAAATADEEAVLRFLMARGAHNRDVVEKYPARVKFLHGWTNRLLLFQDRYHKGLFG